MGKAFGSSTRQKLLINSKYMNNIKSFVVRSAGVVAVASSALMASAAHAAYDSTAFSTTTAVTNSNQFFTDINLVIGGTIVGILTLMAALLGLGWAVRRFKKYVSGRKF